MFLRHYRFNKQLIVSNKIYTVSSSEEEVLFTFALIQTLNWNSIFKGQENIYYVFQCVFFSFACFGFLILWNNRCLIDGLNCFYALWGDNKYVKYCGVIYLFIYLLLFPFL